MKIEYKDADGRVLELEVSDEVGRFCLSSAEEEEKNERRNSRPDRHTSLEAFTYEDRRFFVSPSDPMREAVEDSEVERLLSCLDGRQRELVRKCVIEGWSYTSLQTCFITVRLAGITTRSQGQSSIKRTLTAYGRMQAWYFPPGFRLFSEGDGYPQSIPMTYATPSHTLSTQFPSRTSSPRRRSSWTSNGAAGA